MYVYINIIINKDNCLFEFYYLIIFQLKMKILFKYFKCDLDTIWILRKQNLKIYL